MVPKCYQQSKQETVITPKTITNEQSKASSKAKMNFKHTPLMPSQSNGEAGKAKTRAYTPGGPAGS